MGSYRFHRYPLAVALILFALALLFSPAAFAQEKSYRYAAIDVAITVQPDGILDVSETLVYDFQGGPFTRASRTIALQKLDEIRDITLSDESGAYRAVSQNVEPGTFMLERSRNGIKIAWQFAATSDARRTFTINYRVEGAVRTGTEMDEVWWIAVFPDRSVPVLSSEVVLRLPEGAELRAEDVTLPQAAGSVSVEVNTVRVLRDTPLAAGESLDLRVHFPADLVVSAPPRWQQPPTPQPTIAYSPDEPETAPRPVERPVATPARDDSLSAHVVWNLLMLLMIGLLGWGVIMLLSLDSGRRSRNRQRYNSGYAYQNHFHSSHFHDSHRSNERWRDSTLNWGNSDANRHSFYSGGSGGGGGDAGGFEEDRWRAERERREAEEERRQAEEERRRDNEDRWSRSDTSSHHFGGSGGGGGDAGSSSSNGSGGGGGDAG